MRNRLALRRLEAHVLPWLHCANMWRACGYTVTLHAPGMRCGEVRFEAEVAGRRYVGWADLAELVGRAYPQWSDVAWQSVKPRHLLELMNADDAVRRALVAPPTGWSRVTCTHVADAKTLGDPVLHVAADGRASASFAALPDLPHVIDVAGATHVMELPLPTRGVLGCTTLSMSAFKRLRCGDAVLIETISPEMRVGEQQLCEISIEGNTMTMHEQASEMRGDSQPGMMDGQAFQVDALPVKLEFAFRQRELTVADVARLHPGAVLPLDAGAEHEVKIYANGRYLALGELIQVGERLAVEIQSIELVDPK
ncbi:type III secretion system apparatus protein YscQ/HrcQ [Burkholderia ambifaria IOP40-10]|uniref:Surface presentation of antigens protein SpaO n=1 Tax=Burkholderia ambifaria IOP40-10 TaxID=396596 RepID=B1FB78_9BURK|nr:type III secretion system apparatus protein YscQ/HrcQ [Burkholderia ambifaria IOP40-10]